MWFFAGGAEELSWECATEFDAMGAVSTKYNETPEKASVLMMQTAMVSVIAGGGAVVVVEELEHALARGAKISRGNCRLWRNLLTVTIWLQPSGEGAERCKRNRQWQLLIPQLITSTYTVHLHQLVT